ncbi:hypothetical protein IAQ67_16025 [Paenibacillus peoriae]|uniref:Uncharacterized protein n=1 Tax=Paenibacillus peoriae TaxID=59893 RepID=A0A7H0Y2U3_9BACL|nr:hypothetical protein [Paenibacillus peoriae]QNR65401.1 hypothetical protein IAQ67_16025 [Paenibacillus peoriae]
MSTDKMVGMVIIIVGLVFMAQIPWMSHLMMTRKFTDAYGFGNVKKFKENFHKYNWTPLKLTKGFKDEENGCDLYADIIKFESKGMLINNPISYWLICRYVKKQLTPKTNKKIKEKISW